MRRIIRTWIVGLCAAWLCLPAISIAAEANLPDPLPIETMRAAVYTKAFAKRFVLPDPEPGTEPTGAIQGMEFSMEEIPASGVYARPLYACDLILYLDNTLPIAWPEEGRAGAKRIMARHPQLFSHMSRERFLAMSVEDRRHSGERISRYGRLVRLSTPDYQRLKQGGSLDVDIKEYDREFFPGIAYLKLYIGCTMTGTQLERFLRYGKGVELWFKKPEGKDYRQYPVTDATDFFRVPLPLFFLERVLPWIKAGQDYNKIVLIEETQRNRPQQELKGSASNYFWNNHATSPTH